MTDINFPKLNFEDPLPPLGEKAISTISAMAKNMIGKGVSIKTFFKDPPYTKDDVNQLEPNIFKLIDECDLIKCSLKEIETIFHSIQLWGGRAGRNIYLMGGGIEKNIDFNNYLNLAKSCNSSSDVKTVIRSIETFNDLTKNINISFITKHTRFWLYRRQGEDNALPIYDKVMSTKLMEKRGPKIMDLEDYWREMMKEAKRQNVSLLTLERYLFNHFR